MARGRMQLHAITATRLALFATLAACGCSLWLAYQLSISSKKFKEEHLETQTAATTTTATTEAAGADATKAEAAQASGSHANGEAAAKASANPTSTNGQHKSDDAAAIAACKSCQDLISIYERVNKTFVSEGLDAATIRAIQPWFHGLQDHETPWPRSYEHFPEPLPRNSVRLLVIPLEDAPVVAAAAAAITRDVLALLPESAKAFCNARTNYHCTVFHTSHPTDTRPDPFHAGGGLPANPGPSPTRPGPSETTLAAEAEAVEKVVKASQAPRLVLDRVVMANSGTLLITWVDPSGHMIELRKRMRAAFPGACSKQASIIHTSLVRLLSDRQMDKATVAQVAQVCNTWTAKLKGTVLVPTTAWWVNEHEFSTIVGDRMRFRFDKSL